MKTIYLECNMGAAGDMLMAALLELYDRPNDFIDTMNSLGLEGVRVEHVKTEKCGIQGSSVKVLINGEEEGDTHFNHHHDEHHHHSGMNEIFTIIDGLPLSEKVKKDVYAVYQIIAQAEAEVHNKPVTEVHFHEVGAKDAIADVVGCCLLMELLSPDMVAASPVHLGSGTTKCAHGVLPVPAPATALILRGIPVYGGTVQGELCTPTGAALLKYFVKSFAPMPAMCIDKIGYGMGKKDFEIANCLRAYMGSSEVPGEQVLEISCNLDDMTGEAIGYAAELMMESGALDVFTTPITMKKSRPAVILTCLCKPWQEELFTRLMLANTTTNGVRMKLCQRKTLKSSFHLVNTPYGTISIKTNSGYGVQKSKPEFNDVQKAAKECKVPFAVVWQAALKAVEEE